MPHYSFENTETGEEFDLELSMSEREEYLSANPHVRQLLTRMNVVDAMGIGVTKPPADFQKNVLGRIRDNVPGVNKAAIEKRWSVPKEI